MRDSIVFYRSFYEAVKDLPPDDFKKSVCAIMDYGLDGTVPDTSGIEKTIYVLAKPQIDKNNQRYENGKSGGRKPISNQTETKTEPNDNQNVTKAEPNVNVNDNVNVNVNDNVNDKRLFAPDDESPCAGKFLLNDGSEYIITENDVETYQQLYQGIDVREELRKIEAWCLSNRKKRKTRKGARRFFNGWLNRAQNESRPDHPDKSKKNTFTSFNQRHYDNDELEKMLLNTRPGG